MNINNLFGSRDIRLQILDMMRIIPDTPMLKLEYWLKINKLLHLNPPVTFNEKLQWLKLHDRKPIYTLMADKYEVREYIKNKIGEQYLVLLISSINYTQSFTSTPHGFFFKMLAIY